MLAVWTLPVVCGQKAGDIHSDEAVRTEALRVLNDSARSLSSQRRLFGFFGFLPAPDPLPEPEPEPSPGPDPPLDPEPDPEVLPELASAAAKAVPLGLPQPVQASHPCPAL